jgi:putative Mn2+ efflux pump MntP
MIYESFAAGQDEDEQRADRFSPRQLALLALATSIDALAVGVSFSLLRISLAQTVVVIGVTTFVLWSAGRSTALDPVRQTRGSLV